MAGALDTAYVLAGSIVAILGLLYVLVRQASDDVPSDRGWVQYGSVVLGALLLVGLAVTYA